MKDTPIVIISYNRVTCLSWLVDKLIDSGHKNLHVLDNASFDRGLLSYYALFAGRHFRLIQSEQNFGNEVFWQQGYHKQFDSAHYVLTCSDIIPDEESGDDFLVRFKEVMDRYNADKVGFCLRTDDLPAHYTLKRAVVSWEKQFFTDEAEPGIYRAPIDTTFALCRPGFDGRWTDNAYRTLSARHTSWYCRPDDSEENRYIKSCAKGSTHWTRIMSGRI